MESCWKQGAPEKLEELIESATDVDASRTERLVAAAGSVALRSMAQGLWAAMVRPPQQCMSREAFFDYHLTLRKEGLLRAPGLSPPYHLDSDTTKWLRKREKEQLAQQNRS